MRHRAPRPFVDLLHRLSRATAHRLGQASERIPIRALGILMTASILGIGGYVAIAAVTEEGSSTRAIDPAGPTTTGDAERRALSSEIPGTERPESDGSSPEPGTSAPGQPKAPSSPSEEPPASSTEPYPETDSDSPSTTPTDPTTTHSTPTTPSTTPSQASPSTKQPEDATPPNTSLSEEYPEPDSARFSFSSNERASFTCSLDGAAYTACDSPTLYTDLEPGWHTFSVRATDSAGNVDPSPAETRWHANSGGSGDE